MKYQLKKRLTAITEIPQHFKKEIQNANYLEKIYLATIIPYLATILFIIFTGEIND